MKHDRFCPLAARDWRPSRSAVCQCALIMEVRKGIAKDFTTLADAMEAWAADNAAENATEKEILYVENKGLIFRTAAKIALGNFRRVGFTNG